jgi:hypothetical protein
MNRTAERIFAIAMTATLAAAAAVIAFDMGRDYERAHAPKPTTCPTLDRVATYSTEEIARLLKARRRLEAVKGK